MKKNSIEEIIKIIERKIKEAEHYTDITGLCLTLDKELCNAFINILSNYKRVLKENEILKEEKEQAWEEWNNLEQGSYGTEQKLKQQIKELRKENEELKYKIKGQECVIETQVHNEEVYESIFEKLEKENKELKKQVKSDVNTIF